ncbi:hypothetical protein Nepgr_005298 [Nepenthes gracilis]|uniref:Uncharacterized protein n=1 Tax=Nepenthes gracilis TaxID=150966 RepID=A0AAD3S3F1_NEPGR|nr:hypothetical protein Nepgr_005298 [Nepenthes gracilis]
MERGSFRVYAVGHSFSIISFVSSCMMNLGPIVGWGNAVPAVVFASATALDLVDVLPTYVADPVVLLVYHKHLMSRFGTLGMATAFICCSWWTLLSLLQLTRSLLVAALAVNSRKMLLH